MLSLFNYLDWIRRVTALHQKTLLVSTYMQKCLCLYEHITDDLVCFVSFEVWVNLSSALSFGNFLILTLQLGPLLTVELVHALEWLRAICVAEAEPCIVP